MSDSAAREDAQEAVDQEFLRQFETGQLETGQLETGQATGRGVPAVNDALARLGALDELPVEEHPAVFESVHGSLRGVLGSDGA